MPDKWTYKIHGVPGNHRVDILCNGVVVHDCKSAGLAHRLCDSLNEDPYDDLVTGRAALDKMLEVDRRTVKT